MDFQSLNLENAKFMIFVSTWEGRSYSAVNLFLHNRRGPPPGRLQLVVKHGRVFVVEGRSRVDELLVRLVVIVALEPELPA